MIKTQSEYCMKLRNQKGIPLTVTIECYLKSNTIKLTLSKPFFFFYKSTVIIMLLFCWKCEHFINLNHNPTFKSTDDKWLQL